MQSNAAWREHGGMESVADISKNTVTSLAVYLSGIFDDHRGTPIQVCNSVERQVAAFDVRCILGRIVRDLHRSYCTHNKDRAQSACSRGMCAAYTTCADQLSLLERFMSRTFNAVPARLMQFLGRRYVQYINRSYKRSSGLWEGRCKSSVVQAETYLLACRRYIETNPVRAGMVADPGAYPWSSYLHNRLRLPIRFISPPITTWKHARPPTARCFGPTGLARPPTISGSPSRGTSRWSMSALPRGSVRRRGVRRTQARWRRLAGLAANVTATEEQVAFEF